ncbi:MAG: hypothetical protein GY789_23675 [Hyphomicrobiales bacterium]|nr:hypothetical protein [Hyphomicrobiales bacterium]MCP4999943.1 hypothetical protein [Hyphomicrobiales bacterium]
MRLFTVAAIALVAGGIAVGYLMPERTGATVERIASSTEKDWATSRYNRFGAWESICEVGDSASSIQSSAAADGARERCYMRYVDNFGPQDESDANDRFGTIAAFISPNGKGLKVEFDVENGVTFSTGGFHLAREEKAVWNLDKDDCLAGGVCTFTGPAADALVRAFSDQSAETLFMHVEFTDRYGQTLHRNWPMLPFASAFADFERNVQTTSM